jgi:hypothetical protein
LFLKKVEKNREESRFNPVAKHTLRQKNFQKQIWFWFCFFFFKNKNKSYFIKLFQKQIIFYSTYFKKSNLEICTPNKNWIMFSKIEHSNGPLRLLLMTLNDLMDVLWALLMILQVLKNDVHFVSNIWCWWLHEQEILIFITCNMNMYMKDEPKIKDKWCYGMFDGFPSCWLNILSQLVGSVPHDSYERKMGFKSFSTWNENGV